MKITGEMLIGGAEVRGREAELQAIDPSSGQAIGPVFGGGGRAEVERACGLATQAFDSYRETMRLRNIAVGPVAVFGASNFPLAFSVAGGRHGLGARSRLPGARSTPR